MDSPERTLVIGCGALAHELLAVMRASGWPHLVVQCLPADLHNRPERITGAVRQKIRAARARGGCCRVLLAYRDCGPGRAGDRRLAGAGGDALSGGPAYGFPARPADSA